jgi:hypothetical protein
MERSIVSISLALVASTRRSVVVSLLAKRRLFFLFVDDNDADDVVLCFSFQGTSDLQLLPTVEIQYLAPLSSAIALV